MYRARASQGCFRALTVEKIYLDTSAKTDLEELAKVFPCSLQRPSSAAALNKQWLRAIPANKFDNEFGQAGEIQP